MSYHNNITFTKLTPDDIAIHEDIYIKMLVNLAPNHFMLNSDIPACIYYEYAIKEVQKADDLFQKTFG